MATLVQAKAPPGTIPFFSSFHPSLLQPQPFLHCRILNCQSYFVPCLLQHSINSIRSLSATASRHNATITVSDSQLFVLPDGRTLCFAAYDNSNGYPIMLFHSFPGSRLEAKGVEPIACQRNLQVICPDRPAFGLSTFQPNRRITLASRYLCISSSP